jgi:RNA polymerase sigma-70 factor (sigma-E family)
VTDEFAATSGGDRRPEDVEQLAAVRRAAPAVVFEDLYAREWWPMVRLATGLVDTAAVAEDVVQDAFTSVYRHWDRIADHGAAAAYLRRSVVNASRSALRRRIRARKYTLVEVSEPGADDTSILASDHDEVRQALRRLPDRQREVLTLRYVAELSDPEIAAATGLTPGGVRSASSRGLAALRTIMGEQL